MRAPTYSSEGMKVIESGIDYTALMYTIRENNAVRRRKAKRPSRSNCRKIYGKHSSSLLRCTGAINIGAKTGLLRYLL